MARSWIFLLVLALGGYAGAADRELAHDDGVQKGKQSAAGTGHVVAFEAPRGRWWLTGVRIHGARYGGGYDPSSTTFRVSLCDEALREVVGVTAPYDLFEAGRFGWVDVLFPRVARVGETFLVAASFDPSASRGVYVGWTDASTSYSMYGLPGGSTRPVETGRAWMIRPILAKKPPRGAVRVLELAQEDGNRTDKRSLGGSAHVVEFKKPSGTWWIESVRIFGQPYGGGYDPAATPFRVTIADKRMKALQATEASYALFPRGAFSWADVPLDEPLKCPSSFRAVVDFDPGRTKGVYVGTAAGEKGKAFVGRAGGRAEPFTSGVWMIRVRLVSAKPAAKPKLETKRDTVGPTGSARYVADLVAIDKTVRRHFSALEKKGVDWERVVNEARPSFASAPDDATHVLNATRLLARLGDMHSGVFGSTVQVHVPGFDGLYGGGLWIAEDEGRLVLRATTPDHPLRARVPRGSTLLAIGGRPARIVHEEVRQRLRLWHGWSSTHFLDARLSFQFFPFGERRELEVQFLLPRREKGEEPVLGVNLKRWAPNGRGLSRVAATLPAGLEAGGKAASAMLDEGVGYVRILGGQDEETRRAFDEALEKVKGARGLILDARGMGGGGDPSAWAMAGRFFAKPRPLAHDPTIRPTGPWTFAGPVVLLQDERMVSSAETFTWAMIETKRAIAVGRPTGGATIIPRSFDVPSRLFRFRLGCRDRETSVDGVRPEGVGSPPDVFIPYAASLFEGREDPVFDAGRDVLRFLVGGAKRDVVVETYAGVLGLDAARLESRLEAFRRLEGPAGLAYADLLGDLVERWVDEELGLADAAANLAPDVVGARDRLARLEAVARVLAQPEVARRAASAAHRWRHEVEAQKAFETLRAAGLPPSSEAREAYLETHDGTRWAEAVRQAYP